MEGALLPLAEYLPCAVCKRSLVERVRQLIVQWSMIKVWVCLSHSLSLLLTWVMLCTLGAAEVDMTCRQRGTSPFP